MELSDIQVYLAIAGMSIGFLTALISGAKWVYHRYALGRDHRMLETVCAEIKPMQETLADHETRVTSIEERFDDHLRRPIVE